VTETIAAAQDDEPGPRESRRIKRPPGFYKKLHTGKTLSMIKVESLLYDDNCISLTKAISMASIAKNRADSSVPKNFRQARKHPDYYTHWLPAMEKQHKQLQDIGTWELVDLPEDARALPGKMGLRREG
jgi:hypothetical protein